jgi:alkyldihydroxyacetonephosphate synthase
MPDVKHMKWWGWGVEGVSFHHENKPAFRPFVIDHIDLDVNTPPTTPMSLDDLPIPAPMINDQLLGELIEAVGAENAVQDDLDRIVHTYGKSATDLLRIRAGDIPRVPDVVVYPGNEAEVQLIVDHAVAADAVIIPYGGGTSFSGSLRPPEDATRPVISLDLGRMNQVIDIDAESGLARIQSGAQGPDLEEQLGAQGWVLGHYPDSFTHSTLGGWVATRSSGMQSDKYGDISDIARGMRVVMPGKVLVVRPVPQTSTGPSVREMVLGSEGRLGVITEVTVQVHRIPDVRVILAYLFPSWEAGLAAMQEISTSDAHPSVTRVSDARETAFSFATRKKSSGISISSLISKGLMKVLERRGWNLDEICLSFIGYEGGKPHVARQKKIVKDIVGKHGGIGIGKGPGVLYDQKKYDTGYIRDFLLDRGAIGDVSDTAAPWSKLLPLYRNVMAAADKSYAELGVRGWIMCHLSHSYHSGACLYFTFAFKHDGVDPLAQYEPLKNAIQQAFVDSGGTLSHHHAVGTEHAAWLEQDISAPGVHMIDGLLTAMDPGRNFNPGKIIAK